MNNTDIKNWYNTFASKQKETGINSRHYSIVNKLIDYGLTKRSSVLEVGCGIGTLTKLIHSFVTKGKIVATDISDVSVEMAKTTLNSKRAEFYVTDMQNFVLNEQFDFVVLPDVLEHIPVENHSNLFKVLSKLLKDDGVLYIHIPHPKVIDFIRKTAPETLQVIDQSLNAQQLLSNAYKSNFVLVDYNSYPLFYQQNDYVSIMFKKNNEIAFFKKKQTAIIYRKFLARLKFNWAKS